jgi:hypothetical protein
LSYGPLCLVCEGLDLLMQRVLPIPLAILVQLKLIARVVLVPLRMVIAAGTLAASESDMDDGFAFFCHGLIP